MATRSRSAGNEDGQHVTAIESSSLSCCREVSSGRTIEGLVGLREARDSTKVGQLRQTQTMQLMPSFNDKNGRQKVSIAEIWGAYVLEIDEDGGFRSLRRRAAWSVGLEKEGRLK